MLDPAHLYEIIERRRKELGISQAELGRLAFGEADNSHVQNLRRGSSPRVDRLAALAEVIGYELTFSPKGRTAAEAIATASHDVQVDTVHLPIYDALLSAGAGAINASEHIIGHQPFAFSEIRKHRNATVGSVVCAWAKGESMEPLIRDGDLIMLNTADKLLPKRRRTKGSRHLAPIFAVIDDGEAMVKRVEGPDHGFYTLVSENNSYPPRLAAADALRVVGRVIWWGHSVRE